MQKSRRANEAVALIPPERMMKVVLEQGMFRDQLVARLTILCWVMLGVAAVTWLVMGRSRKGYQMTSVYWLACGLGIWLCLYLPIHWILPSVMLSIAGLSFVFAFVPVWFHHRRRNRAWPENLGVLSEPYRPPGGLTTSVTALGLVLFFLGLCYLTVAMSARSTFLMGVSLLILVQYDYRAESALAGMVLVTLGLVSAFLDLFGASGRSSPTILNLVVIPLSYLAFHWIWLGGVWQRQVHEGAALTTTARMAPLTRHVGIMLLGFSTLLSVKLALWPILPAASVSDTHTNRFILMGVSYGILLGSTIWISRRLASPVMWGLIGMNVYGTILAFVIRTGFFYRVFWPNWMAITGIYVAFFFAIVLLYRFVIRPVPSIVSPGR